MDETYQISVTFGTGNNVSITLLTGLRTVTSSAVLNGPTFNSMPFNRVNTSYAPYTSLANAEIFQDAVMTGALEMPFQFQYTIRIAAIGLVP